jgi:hypothetical protein
VRAGVRPERQSVAAWDLSVCAHPASHWLCSTAIQFTNVRSCMLPFSSQVKHPLAGHVRSFTVIVLAHEAPGVLPLCAKPPVHQPCSPDPHTAIPVCPGTSFSAKRGVEFADLVTLVEPLFNRLTVFDPRFPHGVRQVKAAHAYVPFLARPSLKCDPSGASDHLWYHVLAPNQKNACHEDPYLSQTALHA